MSRNISFYKPIQSFIKVAGTPFLLENPFPVGFGDVSVDLDKVEICCIGKEKVPVVPYEETPVSDLGSLITKIYGYLRLSDVEEVVKVSK